MMRAVLRCALFLGVPIGVTSFQAHDVEAALQAALALQLQGRQNVSLAKRSLDESVLDKQRCKSLPAPQKDMEEILDQIAKGVEGYDCPGAEGCDGSKGEDDDKGGSEESGDLEDPEDPSKGSDGGLGGDGSGGTGDGSGGGGPTNSTGGGPGGPGRFNGKCKGKGEVKKVCDELKDKKPCVKKAPSGDKSIKSLKDCGKDFGNLLKPYGPQSLGGFIVEALKPLVKNGGDNKNNGGDGGNGGGGGNGGDGDKDTSSPGREIGKLVVPKVRSYYDFYLFVLGFIDGRDAAIDGNDKGRNGADIFTIGYGIGYAIYRPITDPAIEEYPKKMIDIYGTLWMHFGFNDKQVPYKREGSGGKDKDLGNDILKKIAFEIERLVLTHGKGSSPKYTRENYDHVDLSREIMLMFLEASRLLHADGSSVQKDQVIMELGRHFGTYIRQIHAYRYGGANTLFFILGLLDGVEDGKNVPEGPELKGSRYKPHYISKYVNGKSPPGRSHQLTYGYKAGYRIGMGLAMGYRGHELGETSYNSVIHKKRSHVFYDQEPSPTSVNHIYGRDSTIDIYVYNDGDDLVSKGDNILKSGPGSDLEQMCREAEGKTEKKCLWNSHYMCVTTKTRGASDTDPFCPVTLVDSCQAAVPVRTLAYVYEKPKAGWDQDNCFLLVDNWDGSRLKAMEPWNSKRRFTIPKMHRSYGFMTTTLKVNGFKNSGCTYQIDEVDCAKVLKASGGPELAKLDA